MGGAHAFHAHAARLRSHAHGPDTVHGAAMQEVASTRALSAPPSARADV